MAQTIPARYRPAAAAIDNCTRYRETADPSWRKLTADQKERIGAVNPMLANLAGRMTAWIDTDGRIWHRIRSSYGRRVIGRFWYLPVDMEA